MSIETDGILRRAYKLNTFSSSLKEGHTDIHPKHRDPSLALHHRYVSGAQTKHISTTAWATRSSSRCALILQPRRSGCVAGVQGVGMWHGYRCAPPLVPRIRRKATWHPSIRVAYPQRPPQRSCRRPGANAGTHRACIDGWNPSLS